MPHEPKKDARLTLRLPSETKQVLKAAAARRSRSTNSLAQIIIERWAAKERRRQPKLLKD